MLINDKKYNYNFDNLQDLHNRWYNAESKPINDDGLKKFDRLFYKWFTRKDKFSIFSTIDGNLEMESKTPNGDIVIKINLSSLVSNFYYIDDLNESEDVELTLDLNELEDRKLLDYIINDYLKTRF